MLGIIGAMDEEVARLKEMISGLHIVQRAGMEFTKDRSVRRMWLLLSVAWAR